MKRQGRKSTLILLGFSLLLFAGYAITLRSLKLKPRKAVHLLGEHDLRPGSPAAFRLVSWDLKWERSLAVNRAEVFLARPPGERMVLARVNPLEAVVHLNVELPAWTAGPAMLQVELETELGPVHLEAEVNLDPLRHAKLELVPPRLELERSPVWILEGTGSTREPSADQAGQAPAELVFYPAGGRLTTSFSTRLLVHARSSGGIPVRGELSVDGRPARPTDQEGFVEVIVTEGRAPRKLSFTFEGEEGRLAGSAMLVGEPSQVDIAAGSLLVAAGGHVPVHLRSLARQQDLYLDAWWIGGWYHSARAQASSGQATVRVPVPAGVEGPVLVQVRDDAFGEGPGRRRVAFLAGSHGLPTSAEALARLKGHLPAEEGFWTALEGGPGGEQSLRAALSRITTGADALPLLADGREAEAEGVASRRRDLKRFGLFSVAGVSVLAWLAVAWMLVPAVRRREKLGRRRSPGTLLLALGLLAAVLAGGWLFLWWLVNGA